jgi:phosphoglycerate dehydrogenase-like enzyme
VSKQRGVVVFADPIAESDRPHAEDAAARLGVALRIAASEEDLRTLLPEARVLVTQRTPVGTELIAAAPELRQVQTLEWISPPVDREAAAARRIVVVDVPNLSLLGVAEHTILLMLALVKRFPETLTRAMAGERADGVEEVKTTARVMSYNWLGQRDLGWLYRKRLGIIGFGKIGRAVAARANAFGMRVIYSSRHRLAEDEERRLGVTYTSLDDLLARADFVSLHARLTAENEHMIGAAAFAAMQATAYFINTARGGLVDEAALIDALRTRRIAGAGLDVFEYEPFRRDSPLLSLDNVVLTPHIAGTYDPDARKAQLTEVFEHVATALAGGSDQS